MPAYSCTPESLAFLAFVCKLDSYFDFHVLGQLARRMPQKCTPGISNFIGRLESLILLFR